MFTAEDRERLRDELVSAARADARISAAALTGSAATGREDRWSDIDLALCVDHDADRAQAIADWTERMYGEHAAVHHVDVTRGETVYRVFLLTSTLQVDVSFWSPTEFGAIGPSFRLLFGTAATRPAEGVPTAAGLIGMGWLYALHARSSIARGRGWQAEYMISAVRDQVLALACLRHELPAVHGRGMDSLPREATGAVAQALVRSLDTTELKRAFAGCHGCADHRGRTDRSGTGRQVGPAAERARQLSVLRHAVTSWNKLGRLRSQGTARAAAPRRARRRCRAGRGSKPTAAGRCAVGSVPAVLEGDAPRGISLGFAVVRAGRWLAASDHDAAHYEVKLVDELGAQVVVPVGPARESQDVAARFVPEFGTGAWPTARATPRVCHAMPRCSRRE